LIAFYSIIMFMVHGSWFKVRVFEP
jgi:hypothetical protein